MTEKLTQRYLKSILHYEPETGFWFWITNRWFGRRAGSPEKSGHRRIGIDGVKYLEHRLVWLYMTGEWPEEEIDHINMIPFDNWWDNLRKATRKQNRHNRGKNKNNTSGYKGVCWIERDRLFVAQIGISSDERRKQICLGYFHCKKEAALVYNHAAIKHYGDFAQFNKVF